ncbi:hypothetical protein MVEN_01136300 [Mycena venus]|uniref:Uncharacterized protein n=1 Tax=Mycena venus TaxID=2733690 RepID=A0A8H6Y9T7_9AGAR|nr:hypothetical protein MVEN_01136300 [Mycena venus]
MPCSSYDPPGFSELHEVLEKFRHKFGEAEYSDRLVVLDLRVGHDGVAAFATSLEADFGSTSNARDIRTTSLLVGPYGIDGFVEKIVIPFLDSLSPDDPSYVPLRALLGNFCGELATKMMNFTKTKSEGKKKRAEPTAGSGGRDGGGGGGYETRSKNKGPASSASQHNTPAADEQPDLSHDVPSQRPLLVSRWTLVLLLMTKQFPRGRLSTSLNPPTRIAKNLRDRKTSVRKMASPHREHRKALVSLIPRPAHSVNALVKSRRRRPPLPLRLAPSRVQHTPGPVHVRNPALRYLICHQTHLPTQRGLNISLPSLHVATSLKRFSQSSLTPLMIADFCGIPFLTVQRTVAYGTWLSW